MTTRNPFPGMNPFFEQRWRDAHTRLITYICEALQDWLPSDLVAGAEEESIAVGGEGDTATFRPDVSVKQPWEQNEGGGLAVLPKVTRAPKATEPMRFLIEDDIERWIEIRDENGQLVTVLELLSPSNKEMFEARRKYLAKRETLISARVNVVEIDLVRQGEPLFPLEICESMGAKGHLYGVCVFRANVMGEAEFYGIKLREALPIISVPLRSTDTDIALELQPLIDRCHERGRYHRLHYRSPLSPRPNDADAEWINSVLRDKGLI